MIASRTRIALLLTSTALIAVCFAISPPILQNPNYHAFADQRPLYGVPNFWNVISNLPFCVVGLVGLTALRSREAFSSSWERTAYGVLLIGAAMVGLGSGYYHLDPDDPRLFWDRLPMTIVFMSLVATAVGERVSMSAGKRLLLPLVLFGIGSVLCWRVTGDLRLYAAVQFGSMLIIPLILLLFPPRYSDPHAMWHTVILYALAKALELLDHDIGHVIATGGHPWKHVAAAAALFVYVRSVRRRRAAPSAMASVPHQIEGRFFARSGS